MKALALAMILLLAWLNSALAQQSRLPACPSSAPSSSWNNCVGDYRYPSGERYLGEWRSGRRHGLGIRYNSNSEPSSGEWRDDQQVSYENVSPDYFISKADTEGAQREAPTTAQTTTPANRSTLVFYAARRESASIELPDMDPGFALITCPATTRTGYPEVDLIFIGGLPISIDEAGTSKPMFTCANSPLGRKVIAEREAICAGSIDCVRSEWSSGRATVVKQLRVTSFNWQGFVFKKYDRDR